MTKSINSDDLEIKWKDAINNSSESWWYAGSSNNLHFIVIKRPFTSTVYKVDNNFVKIEDIKSFEFSEQSNNWVNIKSNNIVFKNANK